MISVPCPRRTGTDVSYPWAVACRNCDNMRADTHCWIVRDNEARGLGAATDKEDEYYIYDREPITNRFIATPKEFAHFNCATFVAGIINGILDGAEFHADVSAHFNTTPAGLTRTVFVIKFNKDVTKRET